MEQHFDINQIDEKELLLKAKELLDSESWQELIALLQPYNKTGRLSIEGLRILGHSYSRNKDYDEAINIYHDLSQRQPHEVMWPYCLAYQYQSKKDFQPAIETYEKCLEIYPKWLKVFAKLAKLYKEVGATEKALKTCRDGIQIYKTLKPDLQKKFIEIYSKLCTEAAKLTSSNENRTETDVNEAEYLFRESISADTQNADKWYHLGNFLLEVDKPDDALQYLQKAESLAPKKEYIPH